ncbi:hypothetical protein [Paenibacillus eucommiae]|uniref:Orotate phosphoribosyltransferase n=1 Tax=Paenibacillus eucommiae TaxID=1355755 RepID=A0ABS4IZG4_9BACL|nr:hypothetical protein [Paenibacillus eucommiae]MBP1992940.1 orotate phosphoribosyltransferase [Paenibacillus eucommiae]
MSNKAATQVLLERLTETNGFSVRNSSEKDAYWYTSGKPGPFYINTENIAGEHAAEVILENITNLLKDNLSREHQAGAILDIINQAVDADQAYNASIDALLDYYKLNNTYKPTIISGGERRDWFFSIPIAKKLQVPHLFLFKSGDYHITDHEGKSIELELRDMSALHVADIINLASSYLKRWIPMLQNLGVAFTETLSVAVRSQEGIDNLRKNNVSVISPLIVDRPLFTEAYNLDLINEFAFNEIGQFYDSPKDWTRHFLAENNIEYSQALNLDTAKKDRIEFFKSSDPYHLKSEFPLFFA